MKTILTRRTLLAAALAVAAPLAGAQTDYPNKPIRLLVGYSAGGGVDALARMLSSRLPALLGQQVVVENRAGAAGMIAAEQVARSAPDGYTLLLGESGLMIAPHLQAKLPIEPLKAFTPIAGTFVLPLMIVANNEVPAANPKELIALLKKNPGRYSYATSGVGTVHHLGFEWMKARTGTFVVHVPYRGASQIVPDVMSGQVPLGVVSATAGLAQAKAGKLRAIGLMSAAKLPGAEDVPALADALPGFDAAPRIMLLAPTGTPAPIVEKLDAAVRSVLASAEVAQVAAKQGAIPAYLEPAQLGREMQREFVEWGKIVEAQKISAQ
ncbi:MAG TPA: tripartite tricarboxylate transporter substrate-binding protein [Ramlibacter sp.]|uniref:Bug family tripartite tricarboxylate transporter substrate binding protein n=1 Tax=Ramlibacter sp. TaxID=1917967 RepID=UPI002D803FED|nr:tripartite tricarboxylate transporter substrate-binding protein [Ramlibacter sp.]HET8745086.1 tripartite tricarboxylate transporter substrate-binding protein [Ramlibacter sp.]